jgi:sugar lactone lactonase YvrE
VITLKASIAIEAHDKIGEGPVWDARGKRLLWVDHAGEAVREALPDGTGGWKEGRRWDLGRIVCAALPRAQGGLLVAGGNEVVLLDESSGGCKPFARLDFDSSACRLNDVKCDARGRLWASSYSTDFSPRAAVYRIDPDGSSTKVLGNVSLGNGFDWSPGGATFYFIDSLECTVDAFDCDLARGTLANRRTVVRIPPTHGVPNGMTVDAEGCLWVALTGGARVRRYAPDGKVLAQVDIDVPGATSCGFAGTEGRDLFITSRTGRVPEIIKALGLREDMMESSGPLAGALFVCTPGARGIPVTPFAG